MNSVRKGINNGRGVILIITILIISLSLPSYISSFHDPPRYEFHEQSDILCTALEQDHEWLAVLLKNGSIYFRHLSNLSRFHTIIIPELKLEFLDDVYLGKEKFMDWNNEGDLFASVIGKERVRIWNTTTWIPQQDIELNITLNINCINWSPRENILAIGTGNMIIIWDADRSDIICNLSNLYSDALYWNPQQPYIGAIRGDHLWMINTDNWEVVKEIDDDFTTFSMNIEWSPDGSHFATSHYDTIKIWESNSWKLLTEFKHHFRNTEARTLRPLGRG